MQLGTNLPKIGSYNRAVVLEAIQASDGISRVQIAARTRLTAQTVSVIVRRLLEEGLVVEDGSAPSSGGKPRTILRVDADAGYAVGVHFDPKEISCVLADLAGRPVARSHLPVRPGLKPEAVIRQMARVARRMTRSPLLGCLGGLLLALDGLHLVLSRTALLDIFLMFWVLAGFACLVADRDWA
ncbi:MarR family transcriptional regulator, partial [Nonomuraea basaltis]|uniref:MarR family transcriptional regulator n=1 Tax=Nonomuraea basaltis TaxID=2495887 RepID=UPI00110C6DED